MPKRSKSKFASLSSINKKRRQAYAEKKEKFINDLKNINLDDFNPTTEDEFNILIKSNDIKTVYLVTNLETAEQFITLEPYSSIFIQEDDTRCNVAKFPTIRDNLSTLPFSKFNMTIFEPFKNEVKKCIISQDTLIEHLRNFFEEDYIRMEITDTKCNTRSISPTEVTNTYISGTLCNNYCIENNIDRNIIIPLNNIYEISSYVE